LAHHKSAIKRIRTAEKSRRRNQTKKSTLKSLVRQFTKAEGGEKVKLAGAVCACADHYARQRTIHFNKAGHIKSQVQKKIAAAAKQK
jgi:small subunit ribosomal protein S20